MNLAYTLLQNEATAWAHLMPKGGPAMFQQWLLDNGEPCGPAVRIKGLRLKPIKQCYQNTFQTLLYDIDDTEWFYTEGVVAQTDLPLLINHAWLTNRKGEVLDPTLRGQANASYFGVPFKPKAAISATFKHGYYGLFQDGCMYNRDIVGKPIGRGRRAWSNKSKQRETIT